MPVVPEIQCVTKALRLEHPKSVSECVGSNAPLFLRWPFLEKEGRKKMTKMLKPSATNPIWNF